MLKHGKILIVGAGRVGTTAAFALILQNIGREIKLIDTDETVLSSECMDLRDSKYFSLTEHVHKGSWEDASDSHIIVLCAGEVLRPESSLDQVLKANKRTFDHIFSKMTNIHRDAIIVVASSPVDALTYYAQHLSGLPRNQVFGTGTLLDTQRLRVKFSKKFGINEKSVHAYVLGEHGDTQFIPWSHASIAGRFLFDYFSEERSTQENLLEEFAIKVRNKSKEILKGKSGTEFGIGACIAAICQHVLYDTKVVLPLCCYVQEYDVCMSILCALGDKGITKYLPLDLTEHEKQKFRTSASTVQRMLDIMGIKKGESKVPSGGDRSEFGGSLKEGVEGDKRGYGIEGHQSTDFLRPQEGSLSTTESSLPRGRTEEGKGLGEEDLGGTTDIAIKTGEGSEVHPPSVPSGLGITGELIGSGATGTDFGRETSGTTPDLTDTGLGKTDTSLGKTDTTIGKTDTGLGTNLASTTIDTGLSGRGTDSGFGTMGSGISGTGTGTDTIESTASGRAENLDVTDSVTQSALGGSEVGFSTAESGSGWDSSLPKTDTSLSGVDTSLGKTDTTGMDTGLEKTPTSTSTSTSTPTSSTDTDTSKQGTNVKATEPNLGISDIAKGSDTVGKDVTGKGPGGSDDIGMDEEGKTNTLAFPDTQKTDYTTKTEPKGALDKPFGSELGTKQYNTPTSH